MPERSERFEEISVASVFKLKYLERFKSYFALKKGAIKNEQKPEQAWKRIKEFKIKDLDISFSMSGEWANMGMEGDRNIDLLKHLFEKHTHLQKLKIRSIK